MERGLAAVKYYKTARPDGRAVFVFPYPAKLELCLLSEMRPDRIVPSYSKSLSKSRRPNSDRDYYFDAHEA